MRRLDRAMDTTKNEFDDDADFEVEDELETWDSDDLQEELEGLKPGLEARKAG